MHTLTEHISEDISEDEDDRNFTNTMANWSRNYPGNIGEDEPYELLFGTAADTVAKVIPVGHKTVAIVIDPRFPSLGYNGLEARDFDFARKLVHEWWAVVFQIMVSQFKIGDHLSDIDLDECIECYSAKMLAG